MNAAGLLRKIRKTPDGHWLWTGARQAHGYGVVRYPEGGQPITAHRAAYLAFVGPVRPNQDVHHLCGVRLCINPAHLKAIAARLNRKGKRVPPMLPIGPLDGWR